MAFLQYPDIIFSLACLISFYIYHTLRTWRSPLPTNWPLLGMTPSFLLNFHRYNDYITDLLKQNRGTFLYKGPWFANIDILYTSDPANFYYISTTNFHNYPKGPKFREIFDILGDGIFTCDSKLWELHRKTTLSLFKHVEFLKLLETTVWNNVEEKLLPVLEFMSECESKIDLESVFQRFTFDSIFSLLADYDPKTLSVDLPFNGFEATLGKCQQAVFYRHFIPKCFWKLLKQLRIGNEKNLSDASELSDELFYKLINEKREKLTKVDNVAKEQVEDVLLAGFMREYEGQTGSFGNHDKFIKDTLLNLMFAGRDTTSSGLTWFFYLIANNPVAKDKIREEIHTQFGIKEGQKLKTLGANELEKLVYLHGALCEALRLFPPVPTNHKVPLQSDTLPSGHHVQKDAKILLHLYTMGRTETIWGQDCLEFKPERWLSKQGGIKQVPSHKFPAFHGGPRACLGKKISLIQMKIVAATIINSYDVEVVEGHPITQTASVLLQMKYGLMVKLIRRNEVKPC